MYRRVVIASILAVLVSAPVSFASPYASAVISYVSGEGVFAGYDDPLAALGDIARTNPGWGPYPPSPVTPFESPWDVGSVVSIGSGGHLTLGFSEPVENHPDNPHGIDLIVYGNAFFFDMDWPNGHTGPSAMALLEPARIEVSQDGETWFEVPGVSADGLLPTDSMGDSRFPADPTLTIEDFSNRDLFGIRKLYNGSAGGVGVDLAAVDLEWIQYIRFSSISTEYTSEIDAVVAVRPIPAAAGNWLEYR